MPLLRDSDDECRPSLSNLSVPTLSKDDDHCCCEYRSGDEPPRRLCTELELLVFEELLCMFACILTDDPEINEFVLLPFSSLSDDTAFWCNK